MTDQGGQAATEPSWPEPGSSVSWFVGQRNSDMSEGRGAMVDVVTHASDPLACYEAVRGASTQGEDGDVVRVTVTVTPDGSILRTSERIYGQTWDWTARRRDWGWTGEFEHLDHSHDCTRKATT